MKSTQRIPLRDDQRRQLVMARESAGLSGRAACEALGWRGNASLRRIESGKRQPTLERLRAMCDLYGLTVSVTIDVEID